MGHVNIFTVVIFGISLIVNGGWGQPIHPSRVEGLVALMNRNTHGEGKAWICSHLADAEQTLQCEPLTSAAKRAEAVAYHPIARSATAGLRNQNNMRNDNDFSYEDAGNQDKRQARGAVIMYELRSAVVRGTPSASSRPSN